jgi:hypothetical protein
MAVYNLIKQMPPSGTNSLVVAQHVHDVWGIEIPTNMTKQQRQRHAKIQANNSVYLPQYHHRIRKWANYLNQKGNV